MIPGQPEWQMEAPLPVMEGATPESDRQLLEGLKSGCEVAYEQLLARFQQPVYNLVHRLIDDPAEASDVTQEVFLKVFRNVGSFRGDSSLKTWIYRIGVNEAHNRRRWFGRHRRPEVGLEAGDEERSWLESLSDQGRTPFDLALNEEWRLAIEKALTQLNPVFRSAVVLRDVEELSYEEISEVLEVSLGTVKSRILRGREALRRSLLEQLEPARGMEFTPQTAD